MTGHASLVSTRGAASLLDASTSTVRRLVRSGALPVVRLGERGKYRFRRDDVLALLQPKGRP